VIWRFTGNRRLSEDAERHAQKLVAISFFLLGPYIARDANRSLLAGNPPSTSWVGIGLSVASIVIMPLLGQAKQVIGAQPGSDATAGEGAQKLLCAYMAAGS
jgi:divalent metal cation (Fe/Co/Zn/Cd) transporter